MPARGAGALTARHGPARGALDWLVPLLACPSCGGGLAFRPADAGAADGLLVHAAGPCPERYPVIDGIPRLLLPPYRAGLVHAKASWFAGTPERSALARAWGASRATADAVVSGFDDEWSRFRRTAADDARALFAMYFDVVSAEDLREDKVVLDAGCGAGRWAREVAAKGPRVIALDLGASVEIARENAAGSDRIACVQADLQDLPIAPAAVDWAYSLGVLHHLRDPERALGAIARGVRRGGRVLVYVYYALDQRGPAFRLLFRAVDGVRRITSRLPRPAVRVVSTLVALLVYVPLARLGALLARLGMRRAADVLPLSFYRYRSVGTMLNDSLDRFGTSVEKRYTREGFARLLAGAGLTDVSVSPSAPYWHGTGERGGAA